MNANVRALELWFQKVQRPLPWRQTSDPYKIWVSETMLQQTQVLVVIPYYERFLKRFPTLKSLALAPENDVLQHWSGLGYYSRARNLQKGARYIQEKHGAVFPRLKEELLEVPGIGPYTAGAVLSIAFDLPVPIVDGNVMRVFARFFGWDKEIEKKESSAFFWKKANEWVLQSHSPGKLNQALMELGATVCTKASPQCGRCPIQKGCVASEKEIQSELPKRLERRKPVSKFFLTTVQKHREKYLVHQNQKGEWWYGLWDFPRAEMKNQATLKKEIGRLKDKLAANFEKELSHQKHTVTHHRLHVVPVLLKAPKTTQAGKWVTLDQMKALPLSSLAQKIVSSLEN